MTSRSEALASNVAQANDALFATIESSTGEQWGAKCADNDLTQGFASFHAAICVGWTAGLVKGMASGGPFTAETFARIEEQNGALRGERPDATKDEALELLKSDGPAEVAMVRNFTDEELDRKATLAKGMPEMTVEQVVEMLMVGHTAEHVESISKSR